MGILHDPLQRAIEFPALHECITLLRSCFELNAECVLRALPKVNERGCEIEKKIYYVTEDGVGL